MSSALQISYFVTLVSHLEAWWFDMVASVDVKELWSNKNLNPHQSYILHTAPLKPNWLEKWTPEHQRDKNNKG